MGAKRLGVEFEFGTRVQSVSVHGDRLTEVQTSRGAISVGAVVNAAGAWAGEIAQMSGYDLPVKPVPRQVAATSPTDLLPGSMPMTIFTRDGFHLRVRDGRVLLIWTTKDLPPSSFNTSVDPRLLEETYARAVLNVPILRGARIDPDFSWAGLYEMSPDKTAILGKSPLGNLFLINGSSGHGVMHSLALGDLLSQVMLGQPTDIDIEPLSLERFEKGKAHPTGDIL